MEGMKEGKWGRYEGSNEAKRWKEKSYKVKEKINHGG